MLIILYVSFFKDLLVVVAGTGAITLYHGPLALRGDALVGVGVPVGAAHGLVLVQAVAFLQYG